MKPTTFITNGGFLREILDDRGFNSTKVFFVRVTNAPVWWGGTIVAQATGEFPAARMPSGGPVVTLLDNGALSALMDWRIEKARAACPYCGVRPGGDDLLCDSCEKTAKHSGWVS